MIAIYSPETFIPVVVEVAQDSCLCGEESDYGCHGIKDSEVFSEYLCKKCYHKKGKV